jgi:hypothetical protein
MHARAFQARFHHQLIPAFHNAAANRPALGLKAWVLDLCSAFFQVSQITTDGLRVWVLLLECLKFKQEFIRAFMFQTV